MTVNGIVATAATERAVAPNSSDSDAGSGLLDLTIDIKNTKSS